MAHTKNSSVTFQEKVIFERRGNSYFYEAWGDLFQFYLYGEKTPHVYRVSEPNGEDGLILPAGIGFCTDDDEDERKLEEEIQDSGWRLNSKVDLKKVAENKRFSMSADPEPTPVAEPDPEPVVRRKHILDEVMRASFTTEEERDAQKILNKQARYAPEQPVSFYQRPDDPAFSDLHANLSSLHPAMAPAIDFLVDELALSATQSKPSPRPILLVGPPGSGKTYFSNDLANKLDAPFFSLSMATADCPWSLTGTNSTWRTAKPSDLIQKIAASNAIAGVLFIDEVTSVKNDSERNHPILPPLLELLDLEQSARFKDQFFDHEMDLSGWVKILACNDLQGLTPAILDRCEVIEITRPSPEIQLQIISLMASKLPAKFSGESLEALNRSSRSLRQIGADLRRLAARALRTGVSEVQEIDVKRLAVAQARVLEHMDFPGEKNIVH